MNRRSSPAGFLSLLIVLLLASAPDPVFAQASRLGNTFSVFPGATGAVSPVRFPGVAYDTKSDVFLTCTGLGNISCAFVGSDGVPRTTRFGINGVFAYNAGPGLAYSPDADAFLVAWIDTRTFNSTGTVWGRLVSYNGGSPVFKSPEFEISRATAGAPGGGANSEARIGVAYSTKSQEFIAVWTQLGVSGSGRWDIRAQRISTTGQSIGAEIPVTMNNQWEQRPSVAYNPDDDEFAIAYEFAPNTAAIRVQRVQAGTGAMVGGFSTVIEAAWTSVPDIKYNTIAQEYLVGWYQQGGILGIQGARLSRTGALIGGTFPIALGYASNDAFGLDFNPVSNAYFTIFHGLSVEDVGNEVSNLGIPGPPFTVTNIAGGNGAFNPKIAASTKTAEWLVVTSRSQSQIVGQRVQTATRNGGTVPPPTPAPTATIDLSAAAAPNGSWFFAEGATGSTALGFDTYYLIANEGDTQAEVRAYIAREDGFADERLFDIAPRSRHTMRLAQYVASGAYSVVIQSLSANEPIWAERAMYWGPNFEGGSATGGVRSLSKQWLFAEGSTKNNNFFDNFFLLFNPGATDANVNATYFLPDGKTPVVRTYTIPKQGRATIHANSIPQLANTDFSAQFDADQPIVSERSMYFGPNWVGGTNTSGAPSAATAWMFAEGAAADRFDTYYTILNPNPTAVTLAVAYLKEVGGNPLLKYYPVPANSRYTLSLTAEVGLAGGVSTVFWMTNEEPFVAERSIYWGLPWVEGTSVMGETALAPVWHLPEGTTKNGFDTYVLIANSNNFPVTTRMTQLLENGQTVITDLVIQATARRTVFLSDPAQFPGLQNQSFATKVEVLTDISTGKAGVLVEHAIYWRRDPQHYWRGGSSAFGIR